MKTLSELLQQVNGRLTPAEKASIAKDIEEQINWLINNDFPRLVQMLYRLDVDENKLRSLLQQQETTDSATLITNLIIERQLKKAEVRNPTKNDTDMPGDERW